MLRWRKGLANFNLIRKECTVEKEEYILAVSIQKGRGGMEGLLLMTRIW
jgi:hypothetical protein